MKHLLFISVFILTVTIPPIPGFGSTIKKVPETHNISDKTSDAEYRSCPLTTSELSAARAYLKFKKIKAAHIPTGIPEIYGEELNISFDRVQDAINKVRVFGPTYGTKDKKIQLSGGDLNRYVNIGSQISCQYCCKVKTLVRRDGVAACGCAHSIMMRGLTAYLIKNHPLLSDEKILDELNTWKTTYFPKQTLTAKLQIMEKSGDKGVSEILKEFPEFLPKMVGGC
jgi:hypothetical protein